MNHRAILFSLVLSTACTGLQPPDPGCQRVVALAAAGEHKPAHDEMTRLEKAEISCSSSVVAAAEDSRRAVAAADALVLKAKTHQQNRDLAAARSALREALDVYPLYHWARKLAADLETEISELASGLLEEAASREASGDREGALLSLEGISDLAPADREIVRTADARRESLARTALSYAARAERGGHPEKASRHLLAAAAARPHEPGLRTEIVEHARRVGLELFSEGQLQLAKGLWEGALELDPQNSKLREYLEQVEVRLQSLERLRAPDPDGRMNG